MLAYGKESFDCSIRQKIDLKPSICAGKSLRLACRNLAITPNKTSGMTSEEVKRICHDYTITGLEAMAEVANPDHPFRFIYTSGAFVERDQEKSLWLMSEHRKMRVSRSIDLATRD